MPSSNLGHGRGPIQPFAFFGADLPVGSEAGIIDDSDDGGNTWFDSVQRQVAVAAIATSLAASTAHALTNSWQDEIAFVSAGDTGGLAVDLWPAASGSPRITYLYSNDEIVAQVTALDNDPGPVLYSVRPIIAPIVLVADEEIVAQPAPPDSDFWQPPVVVASAPVPGVSSTQDEIVPQPTFPPWSEDYADFVVARAVVVLPTFTSADEIVPQPSGIGDTGGAVFDLWPASTNRPLISYLYTDEVIVPQPAPLSIDEGVWAPPFTTLPARWCEVSQLQDEIVAQPTPLSLDGGEWTPPFSVPSSKALDVAQTQDERVTPAATIAIDDSDSQPLLTVARDVWMPVPWQYGQTDGSVWSPIAEDYWYQDLCVSRTSFVRPLEASDDVIVAQPAPLSVDELAPPPGMLWYVEGQAWSPVPWQYGAGEGSIWSALTEEYEYLETVVKPVQSVLSTLIDEVIVPQPAPLSIDEGVWTPPFTVPPVISRVVEERQDEVVVRIVIDEDYFLLGWHVVPSPIVAPLHVSEEWALLPTSIAIDELYWDPVVGVVKNPWYVLTISEEVIGPQPIPIRIDEQYWHTAQIILVPKPHTTLLGEDDVIVKAKRKKPKLVETPASRKLSENPQSRKIAEE